MFQKLSFRITANLPQTVFVSEKNPSVPFGTDILISDSFGSGFVLGVELCEDLWVPVPPSSSHVLRRYSDCKFKRFK